VSSNSALTRFARLLALVPFLQSHQGIATSEAAKAMGISEDQLISDLYLLWMCGLPGYSHLELIDLDFESGHISIQNADTLAKPLSLTSDEVLALSMGLSLLASLPDAELYDDLQTAKAKIQAAVVQKSELEQLSRQVLIIPRASTDEMASHYAVIESAITSNCQVEIEYYVPARDEMTTRTIEPLRMRLVDGISYVDAWCLKAEDHRLFRLDRIYRADGLETEMSDRARLKLDLNLATTPLTEYEISLSPSGGWIVERYGAKPIDATTAILAAGDPGWLLRLALSAGGDLVVTSDPRLDQNIRAAARLALSNYGE